MTSLCGAENLLGGTAVFTFLMETSGGRHTNNTQHTHAHVPYTEGFQCIADSCRVCTNHVVFLSLICHTRLYSNAAARLHSFLRAMFIFCQRDTQCVRLCAGEERGGESSVSVLCICASVRLQCSLTVSPSKLWSPHSCFGFSVSVLSQLSECLSWIFFIFFFIYYTHFSIETIVINLIITRGNNIRVSNVMNCLDLEFNRDGVFYQKPQSDCAAFVCYCRNSQHFPFICAL